MKIIRNEQAAGAASLGPEGKKLVRELSAEQARLYNRYLESGEEDGGELAKGNAARRAQIMREAPGKADRPASEKGGTLWLDMGGKPASDLILDNHITALDPETRVSDIRPVLTLPLVGEVSAEPGFLEDDAFVDYIALGPDFIVAGSRREVGGVGADGEGMELRFGQEGAELGKAYFFPYDEAALLRLREEAADARRPLEDLSFRGDRKAAAEKAREASAALEDARDGWMRELADCLPEGDVRLSRSADPAFLSLYGRDAFERFVGILSGEDDA